MPVTGLPLPLISDGGSALVVTLAMVGVLASFARAEPDAARALHARPPGRVARLLWAPLPPHAASRSRCRRAPAGLPSGRQRAGGEGMATMAELRSVVLAGGGSGGHIYPLLAFADCLRRHEPDVRITCVGSAKGMEKELIPARGYELRHVPAFQLPRSVNIDLAKTPTRMLRSMRAGREVLDEVDADVVVGFGGYVSVPAYLAAWRRHTPIVIHELNVPPGVANRLGMRFTKQRRGRLPVPDRAGAGAAQTPGWSGYRCGRRSPRWTGRPGRPRPAAHFGLDPDRPTLFVFGASQGARSINLAMAGAAKAITAAGIQVLHIIGARNEPVEIPPDLPAPYVTVPYLADMELGYAAGRPGAVPRRRDDLRGDRRGRVCRPSMCRCRTVTASSGATRCPWSRPAADCSSTTPS